MSPRPGAGAAGGLGAALMAAFPRAELRPGIDIVLDTYGFGDALLGADLVITGEGHLDSQTLGGKAVLGVMKRASAAGVPVALVVGQAEPAAVDALLPLGLVKVVELATLAGSVDAASERASNVGR